MPSRWMPAAALVLAACAEDDPSCGFTAQSYNVTLVLDLGDCPQEPPRVASFAEFAVPDFCHQEIMYTGCNPTVSRMCDNGSTRALWALVMQGDGSYKGPLQVTTVAVDPPVTCRYNARLTPL